VNTVQATANLFGRRSAIESLKAGEKRGLGDYEGAAKNEDVMPDCRKMIDTRLIPAIREHITTLDELKESC
jgi:hypothetical protein